MDPSDVQKLMDELQTFTPAVPEEVISFYLKEAGFNDSDPMVAKLVGLATQKIMADIAKDAAEHCKTRAPSRKKKNEQYTLTVEDLSEALRAQGIQVHKQPYYANQS
jgi:transcription initiation factor TFIID subunit 10